MTIRFWGVRGSIATPSPRHVRYGGNTSCVEVSIGDETIIFDSGTGIRPLGHSIRKRGINRAHLLLSHCHWDHINGFPFFSPAFHPGFDFHVMAGHLSEQGGIRSVLSQQMSHPVFPVPIEIMKAQMAFEDFRAADSFTLAPGIRIRTAPLNHPDRATGYRIEHGGKSFCYVTDTEHRPEGPDQAILGLIEGADLVVYDSTYTDDEYPKFVGWGHSTWQEGVRLCRAANVKRLAIFHHDPEHTDDVMDRIAADAAVEWQNAFVSREDMIVTLD
ncbi:MBL fold metallo-hydrolase [Oceanibacterium hippocampi]|uniref:Ribonuclease Z n=1 Tax=Oceanibacterium hippocampi TaxID=745714 RepID=A0A1Y5SGM2_9PROT|nr:MBL fold metallo-hydrolase [Oceanibacterium hippocampi]SLN38614.1 ribonuclease Z [Oceanibacterium hippocampi]